jgi:hypothetical protein
MEWLIPYDVIFLYFREYGVKLFDMRFIQIIQPVSKQDSVSAVSERIGKPPHTHVRSERRFAETVRRYFGNM